MESRRVIIIGAGIGGLSAGYWLRRRGYQVEILEALDRPGGRMATIERGGDKIDVGAQFFHSNYVHAFDLIDAFDLRRTLQDIKGNVVFRFADGTRLEFTPRSLYMRGVGLANNAKLYWFALKPAHRLIFSRMARAIASAAEVRSGRETR